MYSSILCPRCLEISSLVYLDIKCQRIELLVQAFAVGLGRYGFDCLHASYLSGEGYQLGARRSYDFDRTEHLVKVYK